MPENGVANNADLRQFEIHQGRHIARLTYRMREDGIVELIHTEVPKALKGRGFGNRLAAAALEYASRQSLHVIPTCPFVAAYIERHPELSKLTHRDL